MTTAAAASTTLEGLLTLEHQQRQQQSSPESGSRGTARRREKQQGEQLAAAARQRLEGNTKRKRATRSLDEIEAKLKEAALRRQQFHEWLANKAARLRRSSGAKAEDTLAAAAAAAAVVAAGPPEDAEPQSAAAAAPAGSRGTVPHHELLRDRLQSRMDAAERKRQEQERSAKVRAERASALRQAALNEAAQRQAARAAEVSARCESREGKAESNRAALQQAEREKWAAFSRRVARLRARRAEQERRERQRSLLLLKTLAEKLEAAQAKRGARLAAERDRAAALSAQARQVAEAVFREREKELEQRREKLEAKVAKARRIRAGLLRQRGGCTGLCHRHGHSRRLQWEVLSRKLSRCWRAFRGSNLTSVQLAKAFQACHVSLADLRGQPFEILAARITAGSTLSATKALLARLLCRLQFVAPTGGFASATGAASGVDMLALPSASVPGTMLGAGSNIDHLLQRVSPPPRQQQPRPQSSAGRSPPGAAAGGGGVKGSAVRGPASASASAAALATATPAATISSAQVSGAVASPATAVATAAPAAARAAASTSKEASTPPQAASRRGGQGQVSAPPPSPSGVCGPRASPCVERYPVRAFLSAYMVVLQPEAVMSSSGARRGKALRESALQLVKAFEALVEQVVSVHEGKEKGKEGHRRGGLAKDGGGSGGGCCASGARAKAKVEGEGGRAAVKGGEEGEGEGVSQEAAKEGQQQQQQQQQQLRPFVHRLVAFDRAWVVYLDRFVAWKVQDEQQLEEELVQTACKLEASMLRRCGATTPPHKLTHDLQAIRTQVAADHKLLRQRVHGLTGAAGVERLEAALRAVRLDHPTSSATTSASSSLAASPVSSAASSPGSSPSPSPMRHRAPSSSAGKAATGGSSSSSGSSSTASPGASATAPSTPRGSHGTSRCSPLTSSHGSPLSGAAATAATAGTQSDGEQHLKGDRSTARRSLFRFSFPAPSSRAGSSSSSSSSTSSTSRPAGTSVSTRGTCMGGSVRSEQQLERKSENKRKADEEDEETGKEEGSVARGTALLLLERLYREHVGEEADGATAGLGDCDSSGSSSSKVAAILGLGVHKTGQQLSRDAPASAIERMVAGVMRDAFWDGVRDGLLSRPSDWQRVRSLVDEFVSAVVAAAPARMRSELRQRLRVDCDSLQQMVEGRENVAEEEDEQAAAAFSSAVSSLLHSATAAIVDLGAPVRDKHVRTALAALHADLAGLQPMRRREQRVDALVKGLRFLFDRLEELTADLAAAPANLIPTATAVRLLRAAFAASQHLGPYPTVANSKVDVADELREKLPAFFAWIRGGVEGCRALAASGPSSSSPSATADASLPYDGAQSAAPAAALSLPSAAALRSGRNAGASGLAAGSATAATGDWLSPAVVASAGLCRLISAPRGAGEEGEGAAAVPELLMIDIGRVRACQDAFQQMVVVAVGMLLVRQTLPLCGVAAAATGVQSAAVEQALEDGRRRLLAAVAPHNAHASAATLGDVLADIVASASGAAVDDLATSVAATPAVASQSAPAGSSGGGGVDGPMMARLLTKSLAPTDMVLERVSSSVSGAVQVLTASMAGSGVDSNALAAAQTNLRKAGAAFLLEDVLALARAVHAISVVSVQVHEPLYRVAIAAAVAGNSSC